MKRKAGGALTSPNDRFRARLACQRGAGGDLGVNGDDPRFGAISGTSTP